MIVADNRDDIDTESERDDLSLVRATHKKLLKAMETWGHTLMWYLIAILAQVFWGIYPVFNRYMQASGKLILYDIHHKR